MMQKHCVGTYINKVSSGHCGIYHVNGYTLELGFNPLDIYDFYSFDVNNHLNSLHEYISNVNRNNDNISTIHKYIKKIQFRGKYNSSPNNDLSKMVIDMVKKFNYYLLTNKYKSKIDTDIFS
jgi:hypothetical protein